MRHTKSAEFQLQGASSAGARMQDDNEKLYSTFLAAGLLYMAQALGDIYDKLVTMDRKLDAIVFDLAHRRT